jgi:hypothetical protein
MCSFAARGLWADLLSLMHESNQCGFLIVEGIVPTPKQLVGLLGGSEKEIRELLDELGKAKVYSVTGGDMPDDVKALIPAGMPDGVILSRRMVRDEAKAAKDRANGKGGGNPKLSGGDNGAGGEGGQKEGQGDNPPDEKTTQGVGQGVNPPANPQRLEVRGKAPTGPYPSPIETPSLVPARASPVGGSPLATDAADMDQTLARLAERRRLQQVH